MPWARLDDTFFGNKKTIKISLEARGLWVTALSYCSFNLTDGFLTHKEIEFLCGREDPEPLITELVAAGNPGFFEVVDGGYLIHDYLNYNPSREQVLAEREQAKQRMGKGRQKNATQAPCSPEVRANITRTEPEPNLPRTHTRTPTQGPSLPATGQTSCGDGSGAPAGVKRPPAQAAAPPKIMPADHPIAIYCELTRLDTSQVEPISGDAMAKHVRDPALWRTVVSQWLLQGHKYTNVQGMLDWYRAGGPPVYQRPAGKGGGGKNGRGAARVYAEKPQGEKVWGV